MKFKLFAVIALLAFNGIVVAQTSPPRLSEIVKDNYAVVKHTPENPFQICVNIYLENRGQAERNGEIQLQVLHPNGVTAFDRALTVRLDPAKRNIFPFEFVLPDYGEYTFRYTYTEADGNKIENRFTWLTEAVNFFYAFRTPHRLTVCLPDSSNKTLVDVEVGALSLAWTYNNMDFYPYDSLGDNSSKWRVSIRPELNGKLFKHSSWSRVGGYLPILKNVYESDEVDLTLEISGVEKATVAKVTIHNKTDQPQHVRLPCNHPPNAGYNFGWVDETAASDNLLAGWLAPADKVLILGTGADSYPINPANVCQMNMDWNVAPGETRNGWVIRPYNSFHRDLDVLRKTDWQAQFEEGRRVWEDLLASVSKIQVPDERVSNAFYAGITDIFVMREPLGRGYIVTVPGTDTYRTGPNSYGETAAAAVALAQIGLEKEAEKGFRVSWDLQEENGDWTEFGGWIHLMWGTTGFKAWAAMEYYLLTRDQSFLEKRYPQMAAASRWQDKMRKRTKTLLPSGERPLTYGLMPKGMGDSGLIDDGCNYGIFYTPNILAVYADSLAEKAARILGKEKEAEELRAIHLSAKEDLMNAMERGAILDPDGTRWLSSVPGKISGSSYGLAYSVTPTGLFPDNELIANTLHRIERNMSPGGIPLHSGFMADGIWVAIALDNYAQVHLVKDQSDMAVAYLYAVLNHGTPLYAWCEEQGQFPGTHQVAGDMQHLWTPVAVVRYVRDMLVMEEGDKLHLARGIARGWLSSGEPVGIQNASTHFGKISYHVHFDADRSRLVGQIHFPEGRPPVETVLHCPLPEGMQLTKTSVGKLLPDKSGVVFTNGRGIIDFEITVQTTVQ